MTTGTSHSDLGCGDYRGVIQSRRDCIMHLNPVTSAGVDNQPDQVLYQQQSHLPLPLLSSPPPPLYLLLPSPSPSPLPPPPFPTHTSFAIVQGRHGPVQYGPTREGKMSTHISQSTTVSLLPSIAHLSSWISLKAFPWFIASLLGELWMVPARCSCCLRLSVMQ